MEDLQKQLKKLDVELAAELKKNKDEEKVMRGMYKTRDDELRNNFNSYDTEIGIAEETKAKMQDDYNDTANDLTMLKEEYDLLREEARKREEIARILAMKEAEFTKKMDKIEEASRYIQAHWLGMLQRKDRDKAMKGKKKKKKKK